MTDDEETELPDHKLPFVQDFGIEHEAYVREGQWWTGNKAIAAISLLTDTPFYTVRVGLENEQKKLREAAKQQRTKDKYDEYIPHKVDRQVVHEYLTNLGWVWVPSPVQKVGKQLRLPETRLTWDGLPEEATIGPVLFRTRSWIPVIAGVEYGPWETQATKPRPYFGYWCPSWLREMVASTGVGS